MTVILQDKKSIMHLLAGLMADPSKLDNTTEYRISLDDFPETYHKVIYGAICNLHEQGIERVSRIEIDGYLTEFPNQQRIYEEAGGLTYLEALEKLGHPENFELHYSRIKKYSFLRSCESKGINIADIYDHTLVDVKESEREQHKFNVTPLEDMIKHIESKMLDLKDEFLSNSENDGGHMSDNLREMIKEKMEKPTYGANLASGYFTAATRGARLKKYYLVSAGSGVGKSRFALSSALKISVPEIWDSEKKEWIKTGAKGKCLYVGTELEEDEIQIPAACYIADVDEDKVLHSTATEEEWERIWRAVEILEEQTGFWYEKLHDFDLADIEHAITKNISKNGVQYVFHDYIHTSMKMFTSMASAGARLQEHQILAQMSIRLKEITNKHGVFLFSSTQLNDSHRGDQDTGMTDSALSGSKAIAQKADVGSIMLEITKQDEDIIDTVMSEGRFGKTPNMTLNIYKNRGNRWKAVRIWLHFHHGTLRCEDLFVTDYKGKLIKNIKPLHVLFEDMEDTDEEELSFNPSVEASDEPEHDALPDSLLNPQPESKKGFSF